jgi:glycosyltransferase involved in cell wall biosynthesis
MIDILYVAFNRLEMTQPSFQELLDNTQWDQVRTLYLADDGSTDGTREYLMEAARRWGGQVVFNGERLGGPVAAMNWYLEASGEACEVFAKIDNDFVVCPGWLSEMLSVLSRQPGLDVLGTEPMLGDPVLPLLRGRGIEPATHIGGKGLIRKRVFSLCRPVPAGQNGYFGWTQFQTAHPFSRAWISPDLPCFGLDQLPFEPWQSLAEEYEQKGWARRWPPYHEGATAYWQWWLDAQD